MSTEEELEGLQFMCCFCADSCPGDFQIVLCEPESEEENEQYWWAHFGCFERALHPSARIFAAEEEL